MDKSEGHKEQSRSQCFLISSTISTLISLGVGWLVGGRTLTPGGGWWSLSRDESINASSFLPTPLCTRLYLTWGKKILTFIFTLGKSVKAFYPHPSVPGGLRTFSNPCILVPNTQGKKILTLIFMLGESLQNTNHRNNIWFASLLQL